MVFKNKNHYLLLLTDHLPLAQVTKTITSKLIAEKTTLSLNGLSKYFEKINEVIFSGINPHAGEAGLLGRDRSVFDPAIKVLGQKFKNTKFIGPLSGDTIYSSIGPWSKMFVFSSHDQGLAPFKGRFGLHGWNITLGLPFLRISPDFGTAPDIFGQNVAHYLGLVEIIKESLKINKRLC